MKTLPKMVAAEIPGQDLMFYLIDENLDFIPEVKAFLDWKTATRRAPMTIKAYCSRLHWYYCFLSQKGRSATEATPADLTEFVIWLCNPYRHTNAVSPIHQASPLTATSVNLILQSVAALYQFLVRRGHLHESPVLYVDVPRGKWLKERDLLAHTRRGAAMVQRMELKLKEPDCMPMTVAEQDFQTFVNSIGMHEDPNGDPSGFRDRLMCLMLKEGGFRIGEILGIHLEDLDFAERGVHVRFRPHNANKARAKSGYGRDRFVSLPPAIMGLLDLYITEVWVEANPVTSQLWIVFKKDATDRSGQPTYGTALTVSTAEKMFQHYSKKSGVTIHPHMLRHSHATDLARSYLQEGQPVDWKFIQERLGHASVVTTMQIYTHLTSEDRKLAYDAYLKKKRTAHAQS
jgi:integrase/recombinase XerD